MANFCLIPSVAEKFKQEILEGKVDPAKLAAMTSAERHVFFAEHLGESNAEPVNALFESKLLLKNQQQGMITWAKNVIGISKQARMDIISKIQRMDKILSPKDEAAFLEDLASRRLDTHVTFEEATKISDLYKKVDQAKTAMEKGGDRMEYGRAAVDLNQYVSDLKVEAKKLSLGDLKDPSQYPKIATQIVSKVAGTAKSLKATLDNSAIFRQGWKTLLTHPGIWQKNARESFVNLVRTFGKTDVMREINADIVSRPTYDLMRKAKLAVGLNEEAFPESLPEKVPYLGRVYKASENAYNGFVQKTRADVFDKYIQIANKTGVELEKDELESIGKMVNSLTGRAHLGKIEPVANVINNTLFSPRFMVSQFNTFTQPLTGAGGSSFVRKQAAINLLKIITGIAAIMGTAKALGAGVELDPRSSDFGKIKVGNTRFDVTGGMGSIVVLAARFLTKETKSTSTGKITQLNALDTKGKPVFGGQTVGGVVMDFLRNKEAPVASVVDDLWIRGTDRLGNKPTLKGELNNAFTPLPITNLIELAKDPNSANDILAVILDGLGIATNTYQPPAVKQKAAPKLRATGRAAGRGTGR